MYTNLDLLGWETVYRLVMDGQRCDEKGGVGGLYVQVRVQLQLQVWSAAGTVGSRQVCKAGLAGGWLSSVGSVVFPPTLFVNFLPGQARGLGRRHMIARSRWLEFGKDEGWQGWFDSGGGLLQYLLSRFYGSAIGI